MHGQRPTHFSSSLIWTTSVTRLHVEASIGVTQLPVLTNLQVDIRRSLLE